MLETIFPIQGANLSGDLRDPATAIPKGTILAIGFTFFTYFVYGLMSGGCSIRYASGIVQELNFTGVILANVELWKWNIDDFY